MQYRRGCENKIVTLSEVKEELLPSTDVIKVKELYKKWLKVNEELLFSNVFFFELRTLSSEGEENNKEFQDMNFRFQKVKDSIGQWFTKHSKQLRASKISSDGQS